MGEEDKSHEQEEAFGREVGEDLTGRRESATGVTCKQEKREKPRRAKSKTGEIMRPKTMPEEERKPILTVGLIQDYSPAERFLLVTARRLLFSFANVSRSNYRLPVPRSRIVVEYRKLQQCVTRETSRARSRRTI